MLRHWKIRNMANRNAYYVPITSSFNMTALDQVAAFMKQHAIKPSQCRILETGARFLNITYREYVMSQLRMKEN